MTARRISPARAKHQADVQNMRIATINKANEEIKQNGKTLEQMDVDQLSKRSIMNLYYAMRGQLGAVITRLFFYAPEDEYFKNFSDEDRDQLTKAAHRMYGGKDTDDQGGVKE